jgi:hypothetical protein
MFDMSRVGPTILDMPSGYMTPAEAADHLIKQGAPEGWARNHVGDFSNLDSIANRENYARGGSVIKQPRVTSRFAAALTAKG